MVPELADEDYRHAALDAFSRTKPEERVELGKQIRDQSLQQGYDFPEPSADTGGDTFRDPTTLRG